MKSLLLIGTGKMAKYYSEYISKNEEVTITAFNPNNQSKSALNFSKETGIPVIHNVSVPFNYAIACCSWDQVMMYKDCPFASEKILLEKPILFNRKGLQDSLINSGDSASVLPSYYVAFNRRFYSTVKKVKDLISNHKLRYARLSICDSLKKFLASNPEASKENFFHYQLSHYIDTIVFLLGEPLEIINIAPNLFKINFEDQLFLIMEIILDSPKRNSFEFFFKNGTRAMLSPFESLSIFDEMTHAYCSEKKMTSWTPNICYSDEVTSKYKPGIQEMVSCFVGDTNTSLCTYRQALVVHMILDQLIEYSNE